MDAHHPPDARISSSEMSHAGADLVFDRASIRELDRSAIEDYGLPGVVLMENAARSAAAAILERFGDRPPVIVCGPGNNGGDGWALARHLDNAGSAPRIVEFAPPHEGSDAAVHRQVAIAMGVPVHQGFDDAAASGPRPRLVIDALFGTGLARPLAGRAAALVRRMDEVARAGGKASAGVVVALDLPSGIDADTGVVLGVAVRADWTLTFVGLKPGLLLGEGRSRAGTVVSLDIGAPAALARRLGRPRSPGETGQA